MPKAKKKRRSAKTTSSDAASPWLRVVGARQNNLRDISVDVPLQRFICVTGVSGSGKSSLVNDILRETLARDLNGATKVEPGDHDRIEGIEHLDKVIDIDQSPIGRTPRSNPATYIKVFDLIRDLYTKLPDAKVRGYKPGRFSFNVKGGVTGGGRCEACEGHGSNKMEMDFLADIWVTCPVCQGRRFNRETLQILYKGKTIHDVLDMDVQEALEHFAAVPRIAGMLQTLHDVGMDYVKLGQSSTTLSGGEAQRIKLARELVKRATGRTLYILDEPTTGLHFDDIKKLLAVLHGFVDAGNTVVVIEHNLDVIKTADWVIDLGPEGGAGGGRVVAQGTPEHVAKSKRSHTGAALRDLFTPHKKSARSAKSANGKPNASEVVAKPRRDVISVVGAKQHNLKNLSVEVPRGKMSVCSGPSGSGKTSFAIDTVYTEGQRRYVESLSSYARQFIGQLQPPKVDHIHGLSPSICIEQKNATKSPRSTVGTITEIHDYMRVLWARIGEPHCPKCRVPIGTQSADEIVERILELGEGTRAILLAPVERTGNESYQQLFERERAGGYARVRVDGVVHPLDAPIEIDARRNHDVELVVDRVVVRKTQRSRITDSVEQTLAVGNGVMLVEIGGDQGEQSRDRKGAVLRGADSSESSYGEVDGDASSKEPQTAKQSQSPRRLKPAARRILRFSQHRSCAKCGTSYDELTPHHFSFNSRLGWCETCEGLGTQHGASVSAIVVNSSQSILDGAIAGWKRVKAGAPLHTLLTAVADHIGFDAGAAWNTLAESQRLTFLHGCGDDWIELPAASNSSAGNAAGLRGIRVRWKGFYPAIARATRVSWQLRNRLEDLVTEVPCDACRGSRLRPDAAAVRLAGETIHDICTRPMGETLDWFTRLKLDARQKRIAGELMHEITSRLRFLVDVGLDYISLHRGAATLSGGESQRIQLAAQIGTGLTGVLYVLDEPTIGLHPRDNNRLIRALAKLRDLGNTLLLVEHDREVIDAADHLLDFGPGAGRFGGEITAQASPKRIRKNTESLTGQYLAGNESIPVPTNRRPVLDSDDPNRDRKGAASPPSAPPCPQGGSPSEPPCPQGGPSSEPPRPRGGSADRWLTVHGARENNLQSLTVAFPLGRFTCVTGVSGSGKSSLVTRILHPALAARLHRASLVSGDHDRIEGLAHVDKVINVDQSPIGQSPSSNAATFTGVFDEIRELFAKLPASKIRGYTPGRFSFNRPGGRCEACEGMGQRCIEMHFLPDVWIECEHCNGSRYVTETLEVRYRGRSIADVLAMSVSEALALMQAVPRITRMLQTLDDVGLGYLSLGQAAPTLSGGEAQRVKLAAELGKPSTGKTLYILDEPTTGLHFDDLKKLLGVLHRLVDLGNSCICIEHNLDVIKSADWVIDLGPEAGRDGGSIVVEGTPEQVAATNGSHTGTALKPVLEAGPHAERTPFDPKARKSKRVGRASPPVAQPVEQASVPAAEEVERASPPVESDPDLNADQIKMPWQVDGRRWHTVDHRDRQGRPVEWDPEVLVWLIERMEATGRFDPADWNDRARVEVKAPGKGPWFCHVLTGGKDLLDILLRVPKGAYDPDQLAERLGIRTLDERTDLPVYGQWSRVTVRRRTDAWDGLRIAVRDFTDVRKRVFGAFIKEAAAAYAKRYDAEQSDATKAAPWKTDGKTWHLSQKAINPRHTPKWQPALLPAVIGMFRKLQPDLTVDYSAKVLVTLHVPGEAKYAARIITNMPAGLRVEIRAPAGAITPVRFEQLGFDREIRNCGREDFIVFWTRALDAIDPRQLADVWQRRRPDQPATRQRKGKRRSA